MEFPKRVLIYEDIINTSRKDNQSAHTEAQTHLKVVNKAIQQKRYECHCREVQKHRMLSKRHTFKAASWKHHLKYH